MEVRYPSIWQVADDEIAKAATNALEFDLSVPKDAIQITVRDGVISLLGAVSWQFQKLAAENALKRLAGVIRIINDITLTPSVSTTDLKEKIEKALKRHAEVEAQGIRILVHDNKVTLEGKVDNWDERQAVANAAWSAPVPQVRIKFRSIE